MTMSPIQAIQTRAAERRAKEQAEADAKAEEAAREQAAADDLSARRTEAHRLASLAAFTDWQDANDARLNAERDDAAQQFEALSADPKATLGKLFDAWVRYRQASAVEAATRVATNRGIAQLSPGGVRRVHFGDDALGDVTFAASTDIETKIAGLIQPAVDQAMNDLHTTVDAAGRDAVAAVK